MHNWAQCGGKLGPRQAQRGEHGLAAEVWPKSIRMGLKLNELKLCVACGGGSHGQSGTTWNPLAAASHPAIGPAMSPLLSPYGAQLGPQLFSNGSDGPT